MAYTIKTLQTEIHTLLKKQIQDYKLTNICKHFTDDEIEKAAKELGGVFLNNNTKTNSNSLFKIIKITEDNEISYIYKK